MSNRSSSSASLTTAAICLTASACIAVYLFYRSRRQSQQRPDDESDHSQSSKSSRPLRIGTRRSRLALWQADHVRSLLLSSSPHLEIIIEGLNTAGDLDQSSPLTAFTNKGVFTKELDLALLSGKIDLAVHCMKDLPTVLPDGLEIAAVLSRAEVEDAVVIRRADSHQFYHHLTDLPNQSIIGTSALRRRAAIAKHHPQLQCKEIRGNVETRLRKLDEGQFDAVILAKAGLQRLGLEQRITEQLDIDQYGYAVGQGALAVVTRIEESAKSKSRDQSFSLRSVLKPLNDEKTALECEAERALLKTLQGGCKVPIAVRSKWISERRLGLWAIVLSPDGQQSVEYRAEKELVEQGRYQQKFAEQLGCSVGNRLLEIGADRILAQSR